MGTSSHNSGARGYGPYDYSLGDELRGERATLGKTLLDIQRDLRIKAAYIAAIEDAKPEVFPNPSFVSGYVRSYARYLGLDPDEIFHRFCQESGFTPAAAVAARPGLGGGAARKAPAGFDFPLARKPLDAVTTIPFGAIGSLAVLLVLIAGLGYGGRLVLENIQRVEFAPVEDLPVAVAEVDPLAAPEAAALEEPELTELEAPVATTALAELYRQQELEVPIIAPRDGPIAALDPDTIGVLARRDAGRDPRRESGLAASFIGPMPASAAAEVPAALIGSPEAHPSAVAGAAAAPLLIVAERAAWIRVYQDNGTVLFERILEQGESYTPPAGVTAPLIWAGNSGSVYVRIGETLRGPLGHGTRAAKDILLEPAALAERFPVVEDVPEVISQSVGVTPAGAAVTIR